MQCHKLLCCLLVAAAAGDIGISLAQTVNSTPERSLFLSKDLTWHKPPSKLGHAYQTAVGSIFLFENSGSVQQISTSLFKDPDGSIQVNLKGGYTIRKGSWTLSGSSIRITERVIYTSAPRVGTSVPGPEESRSCSIQGAADPKTWTSLLCGASTFSPLRSIANAAEVDQTLKFHSRRAEEGKTPQL